MKLLITGGCGFLGSNLAIEAMTRGDELLIFDNLMRPGSQKNLEWLRESGSFIFEHGDIRNQNDIKQVIREFHPDAIFHLAGQVAMTTSIANPRMDFEINVVGTHNLLEAVREFASKSVIVYSSTNKVYGDLEQFAYKETSTRYECLDMPNGFNETIQLSFHSPYGCSKGAADQYMLDYARIFGLNTIVFRHSSMYGGRQFATYDQGWIGWFCRKAVEKLQNDNVQPYTISGNGKQVRDVLHAKDIGRLYLAALTHFERAKGEAFNIGGGIGNSLSLIELFDLLEKIAQVKLSYINLPARESDQRVFIADISKAKSLLNWTPQMSVNDGISQMVQWTSHN